MIYKIQEIYIMRYFIERELNRKKIKSDMEASILVLESIQSIIPLLSNAE